MNGKKICLILQTITCILLAAQLAAGAVILLADGLARRAENPLEPIYTAESVSRVFTASAPLFFVFLALLAAGLALKAGDPGKPGPAKGAGPVKPERDLKHKKLIQAALVIAALVLITAGILNGSALDVLIKAIHICTECIGLG